MAQRLRPLPALLNALDSVRADPTAKRLDIGDLLFAQFTCPEGDDGIWTQTDYLIHLLSGTAAWETATGTWSGEAGDILYFKKGSCCFPRHSGRDLCLELFFLPDEVVRESVRELAAELPAVSEPDDGREMVFRVNKDVGLSAFFQAMAMYLAADDKPAEALLRLKLKELLASVLLGQRNPRLSAYLRALAASGAPSIAAIMETNFRHKLSLESLAQMCHRSLSSFRREFLRLYGTSPGKWLLERRLEHSASLLRNTRMSVTEVMLESGFEDPSHFSKAFKQRFGRPPSTYRQASPPDRLDVRDKSLNPTAKLRGERRPIFGVIGGAMRTLEKMVRLSLFGCAVLAGPTALAAGQEDSPGGNPVLHWNAVAVDIFPKQPGPILDSRAFAILHAAVHDALNAIERRYQPYTVDASSPHASVPAAVATAARDVLLALSPDHRERIEAEYTAALAAVPDGRAEDDGVALGRRCAQANLERRAGDGIPIGPWPPTQGPITEPVYTPNGNPGDYDFTPPFDRPPLGPIALFPGWGRLEPFAVDLTSHRPPGPDRLSSRRYADDLNYLKSIGRLDSTRRTAEQTEIARFWFEPLDSWYRIATTVLEQRRVGTWRSARILALMSFAVTDAGIAVFEAKYRFRFWRPYTAIRRAAEDGNRATDPDADWLPLLWTPPEVVPPHFTIPPIPEYPSAAAIVSAAAAEVLMRNLGDRHSFETVSTTLPGVRRQFRSFSQAARETRMSRIYGGIHFLRAVEDGYRMGKGIGRAASQRLPRVPHAPAPGDESVR